MILRDAMPSDEAARGAAGDVRTAWAPALAILSLGAGFLHAAVIDPHRGPGLASELFTAAAIFQVAWAALVLIRPTRVVLALGAVGNLALVLGWLLSRTSGIGFLSGFEDREEIAFTDAVTTALEVALVIGAAALLIAGARWRSPAGLLRPAAVGVIGLVVALVGVPAVASASSHGGGAGADHHGGGDTAAASGADHHGGAAGDAAGAGHHAAEDPSTATPEQRAAADTLLADTRAGLWQWTDEKKVYEAGFRTIRDGLTGFEHLVNWDWINDDTVLDPNKPESLVYRVEDGKKYLEAAMYMAPAGTADAEVPDIGGPITQWHIHDNLCYSPVEMVDGAPQRVVVGLTSGPGQCGRGEYLTPQAPMLHVWTVEKECGPFSSLEGVGAGQSITEKPDPSARPNCQHS